MTFAQLQAFVAVIESGSFTTASEVPGITQSAVSHALASLETELVRQKDEREVVAGRRAERKRLTLIHSSLRVLEGVKNNSRSGCLRLHLQL